MTVILAIPAPQGSQVTEIECKKRHSLRQTSPRAKQILNTHGGGKLHQKPHLNQSSSQKRQPQPHWDVDEGGRSHLQPQAGSPIHAVQGILPCKLNYRSLPLSATFTAF